VDDLAIPNRIGGPIKSWNVVAEIRGSEKPDEFVILGAHLDSWELGRERSTMAVTRRW